MHAFDPFAGDELLVDGGLELLSERESLALASSRAIGRVGLSVGALPMVVPVNFCLVDRDVVFHTAPGTKLDAALRGAVVAFEVDDVDPIQHRGWSVLMVGIAGEVPREELPAIRALPVRPWVRGHREHVVRVRTELVSGRRIATRR
jgi:hypothetical protein